MDDLRESVHRTELTVLQRSEQIAEYARLTRERLETQKGAQVGQVSPGGRGNQGGDSLAARELEVIRQEVQRAQTIAALPDEVKARAVDLGFDLTQSALLQAAKASTPQAQVAALERHAEPRAAPIVRPLRNLECLAAGELARWIKQTTPHNRMRVIRLLEETASILRDEMEAEDGTGHVPARELER